MLIPSSRRLELEQLIEELMQGVEGYKHLGTYEFDPNKPQFFQRKVGPAKKANGEDKSEPVVVQELRVAEEIFALISKDRRPFTKHELTRKTGCQPWIAGKALAILVRDRRARVIARGIYEAMPS
jgi:hypothetical protein